MQQTEPTYDYTDYVINQKYQFATPENREKILEYIVHIEQAVENYFISVGSRFFILSAAQLHLLIGASAIQRSSFLSFYFWAFWHTRF